MVVVLLLFIFFLLFLGSSCYCAVHLLLKLFLGHLQVHVRVVKTWIAVTVVSGYSEVNGITGEVTWRSSLFRVNHLQQVVSTWWPPRNHHTRARPQSCFAGKSRAALACNKPPGRSLQDGHFSRRVWRSFTSFVRALIREALVRKCSVSF